MSCMRLLGRLHAICWTCGRLDDRTIKTSVSSGATRTTGAYEAIRTAIPTCRRLDDRTRETSLSIDASRATRICEAIRAATTAVLFRPSVTILGAEVALTMHVVSRLAASSRVLCEDEDDMRTRMDWFSKR